jgi:hypothetical protein
MTPKIHAVVDTKGLPLQLGLTTSEAHDNRLCSVLLNQLSPQTLLLVRVDDVCSSLARAPRIRFNVFVACSARHLGVRTII